MFYVYILYMWPTVWIRSIVIIFNSIYHYQSGMKTCYICLFVLFLRKKDLQWNLLAYIQCFFSDTQNVISLGCCQHPFVGLLESIWKNIFRRKPTIREFKIERNRISLFIVWIFKESSMPPTSSFPSVLAGFQRTQFCKSGWPLLPESVDVLRYRIFRRGKQFIPLEKAKQGLHRPAFNSVCKFQQQNCSYSF